MSEDGSSASAEAAAPVPLKGNRYRDVIVIGASAGGVETLRRLFELLPAELPAAVFVVLHLSPTGTSALPAILDRAGRMRSEPARDGEETERGRIYIAPPNRHLLVQDGHVELTQGPKENGHRPAVDPLFRSAARAHGDQVIGVVLSGAQDDGVAGLRSVYARGGTTVVQDPDEALYPGMPRSAIANAPVDHVVALADMPGVLSRLLEEPLPPEPAAPAGPEGETSSGRGRMLGGEGSLDPRTEELGAPSGLTCPECGGALFEYEEGDLTRWVCRVGHAYSPTSLDVHQGAALEAGLWSALRSLEERSELLRRVGRRAADSGSTQVSRRMEKRALAADRHAETIRSAVLELRSISDAGDETAA